MLVPRQHKIGDLVFFIRKFSYNARRFVAVANCAIVAVPEKNYKFGLNIINKLNGDTGYVF